MYIIHFAGKIMKHMSLCMFVCQLYSLYYYLCTYFQLSCKYNRSPIENFEICAVQQFTIYNCQSFSLINIASYKIALSNYFLH